MAAAAVAGLDVVLLLGSVGTWLVRQVPLARLTEDYLIGNAAIGTGFAVGGALITLRVRRSVVGWLMLGAGTLYLVATATGTWLYQRLDAGLDGAGTRALAAVHLVVWMPAIALLVPLAVQLFPTGRPLNRAWTPVAVLTVVAGVGFSVGWALDPVLMTGLGLADDGPLVDDVPRWVRTAVSIASLAGASILASLLAPVVRLVRRPGEERLQVLWLVWAVVVALVVAVPSSAADVPPPLVPLVVPLVPLAMTAAVLRHRLYGITVVVNRTLVYLALTATLLLTHLAVVQGMAGVLGSAGAAQVLATAVVAVGFAPVRAVLQRAVDRWLFGSGADPYGALSDLGRRLQSSLSPEQVLPAIATTVADALKLPYVQVRAGRPGDQPLRTVELGTPTGPTAEYPLTDSGAVVGALVVAADARPRGLGGPRHELLADLVRQAGPAVHAVVLTEELQSSRERTITALEEERTRIHRDLHDGLGPALTGVVLKAEAAGNLVGTEPARAAVLMADVSSQTRTAVDDVRRLVYGLRPPALDRLGLRPALEGHVDRLAARPDGPRLALELPADLPRLPAPVEVAAYRIVTEALANVLRHSGAGTARARLWVEDDSLHLEVCDDGPAGPAWVPGVGLVSMRERTEQLGGGFSAAASPSGGVVTAWLPLALR